MYPYMAPPPPKQPQFVPVIAGAMAALVLVALGVFVVPPLLARPGNQVIGDGPTHTVVPTHTTTSPTPAPTSGTEYTRKPNPNINCAGGNPLTRTSPSVSGQLTGGGLVAPAAASWEDMQLPLLFANDIQAQKVEVTTGWINVVAVGSLDPEDGFTDAKVGAEGAMDCLATAPAMYPGLTKRVEVESKSVTISGHPGWHIRQVFQVNQPAGVDGDVVDVIVVEVSENRPLGFFTGSATVNHASIQSVVDKIAGELAVA